MCSAIDMFLQAFTDDPTVHIQTERLTLDECDDYRYANRVIISHW
jgi:hypothetical protein